MKQCKWNVRNGLVWRVNKEKKLKGNRERGRGGRLFVCDRGRRKRRH